VALFSTLVVPKLDTPKKKKTKKAYRCKGCDDIFRTRKSLRKHQRNNYYEFFYKKVKGRIFCKICKTTYPDWERYKWHWKMSPEHDNRARLDFLYKTVKKSKSKWIARPIHKLRIQRHIKNDRDKKLLRSGKNATRIMMKDIDYGFAEDEMDVIEIVGPPGHGKSVTALWVAVLLLIKGFKKYGYVSEIHIGFSFDKTQEFASIAKRGDVIIQDEDPEAVGEGSRWYKSNVENLMKTMRADGVHYIFVSPKSISYLWNQQFVLEAYQKNKGDRVNMLALYDAEQHALGWVYIPILDADDPLMVSYLKKKMANIKILKESGGSFSVQTKGTRFEKDVDTVYTYITESTMWSHTYIPNMSLDEIEGITTGVTTGIGKHARSVARAVQYRLKSPIPVGPMPDIIPDEDLSTPQDRQNFSLAPEVSDSKDLRVLSEMFNFAVPKTRQEKLGHMWWKYYIRDGIKQIAATAGINEELEGNDPKAPYTRPAFLNTFFPAYLARYECFGRAGELAIQKLYYPNCKHEAKRGEPDLRCPKFIVEIKVRPIEDQRSPHLLIKEEPYLIEYMERKEKIKLVVIRYARKLCVLDIYDVVYDEPSES